MLVERGHGVGPVSSAAGVTVKDTLDYRFAAIAIRAPIHPPNPTRYAPAPLAPYPALLKHWPCSAMVCHFLVRGRVQGVGFRWFVHREAAALSLHGWVRNTEDGHVEVLAAGDPQPLAQLARALRKGSRGSRVDAVVEHELDPKEGEDLGPFRIEGAW